MILDLPEHRTTEFWVRTKSDEEAVRQGCYFDWDAANRVREFCRRFIVNTTGEWAGKPFELTKWQWFDFVAPLFGWKKPNGTRRFTRFGVGIPKKNGKSTLTAALMLYMLIADNEPNAEVYVCSTNKQQAKIVYREAQKFIDASEKLKKRIRVREYWGKFESQLDLSFVQVLAAENKGKHGFNSHFTLFDEFHEQPNWELWNTMRYAGDARRQSILGWISTAGFDAERPWAQEWDYCKSVIRGDIIDVSYLCVIYEAEESDDYEDEATWYKANPSLGVTIKIEKMREDFQEVKNKGSIALRDWRILKLNQRIKSGGQYVTREAWDACAVPGTIVEAGNCFAALDLASTRDLNALAFVSWQGDKLLQESFFWCPKDTPKRERSNAELYDRWTDAGQLSRIPGSFIDWDRLSVEVIEKLKARRPRKVLVDPHNASRLVTLLREAGFEVVFFGQNYLNYNEATREFDRLVSQKLIAHSGNAVMSYCVGNCTVVTDRMGHMMPDRSPNRLRKIDGVPATLMALAEAIKHAPKKGKAFESW